MTGAGGGRPIALFPGQLSEKAGMGEALAARYGYVSDLFHELSRASGVDLGATFFGEGSSRLHEDLPAQVGVFAVSVAALEVLRREHGIVPAAAVGYSLGTYAALVSVGCLEVREGLDVLLELDRLLRSGPPGAMGFSIGLSREEVEGIVAGVSTDPLELGIANENAPRQIVVSGSPGAVARFVALAAPRALKADVLPIDYAMHSPRLAFLEEPLSRFVAGRVPKRPPSLGALFAPMTGGRVADGAEAARVLALQIARPSRWEAAVRAAAAAFPTAPIAEVGPGSVLARMGRWILRREAAVLEDPESIAAFAVGQRERGERTAPDTSGEVLVSGDGAEEKEGEP